MGKQLKQFGFLLFSLCLFLPQLATASDSEGLQHRISLYLWGAGLSGNVGNAAGSVTIGTGSRVRTYDEGTLIIDITDVASGKLVWRGVSSQALPDLSDPQTLTNQINATVAAILAQYPPKQ